MIFLFFLKLATGDYGEKEKNTRSQCVVRCWCGVSVILWVTQEKTGVRGLMRTTLTTLVTTTLSLPLHMRDEAAKLS
jgi:hypothetical protein